MARDSVAILNRPLSRMDIFYTGSTARLNASLPVLEKRGSRMDSVLSIRGESLLALEAGDWKERLWATLAQLLDTRLLKSPTFLLLAFGGFLTLAGFFGPFIYLPRQAMKQGVDETAASFLVSILGIANIIFRILCGWLSDQSWADPLLIHNSCLIIGGLATVAVPFLSAYWALVLYCLAFGLSTGAPFPLPPLLRDVKERSVQPCSRRCGRS